MKLFERRKKMKFKTCQSRKKLIRHQRSLEKQLPGLFKKSKSWQHRGRPILEQIKKIKDKIWSLKGKRQGYKR